MADSDRLGCCTLRSNAFAMCWTRWEYDTKSSAGDGGLVSAMSKSGVARLGGDSKTDEESVESKSDD